MSGTTANENFESCHSAKPAQNESLLQMVMDAWSHRSSNGGSQATVDSAQSARDAKALGLPDTKIVDPANPSPDSWKYDSNGHLLSAGNRVSAQYDAHGDLQKATVDGETWERKGNDVQMSFKDRDGVTQTDVMHNVKKFDLTTQNLSSDGKFKDATIDVQYGRNSEAGSSTPIWQTPEHQDNMKKLGPSEKW